MAKPETLVLADSNYGVEVTRFPDGELTIQISEHTGQAVVSEKDAKRLLEFLQKPYGETQT